MTDADALFDAGLDCLGAGRWEEAVVRLRAVLALAPGHRDAMHGLIRALDQAGRAEEALVVARELIVQEPEDVLARTSLSMVYQRMGRIEEAEKAGVEARVLGWKMELRGAEHTDDGPEIKTKGSWLRAQDNADVPVLYVASTNMGKMRDFGLASGGRVKLMGLPGLEGIAAPAEDEVTFEGNAVLKARYYSNFLPGEIVVADDSGLEVDGLGGAPGVRSARYAEDVGYAGVYGASLDERNNACLLNAMQGVEERAARYRCALAAARDGEVLFVATGSVEGKILPERRGVGGFGYDPLFAVDGFGRTMAELGAEERLEVSHRGRALKRLLEAMDRLP